MNDRYRLHSSTVFTDRSMACSLSILYGVLLLTAMAAGWMMEGCEGTTFTLENSCSYPVWPGVLPDAGQPTLGSGGFLLEPGQAAVLNPPPGWSGRFWARTGCVFNNTNGAATPGATACATGDCGGVLGCAGAGGSPPVTLAEFTLGPKDFYDVSLVDGYNVPLMITPKLADYNGAGNNDGGVNCTAAGCTSAARLLLGEGGGCPAQLQVESQGRLVACRSACQAFNAPQYCCTGAFAPPQTCGPTSYSRIFKAACPTAYSYAYDDPSSTFTCTAAIAYTMTFCPA